MSYTSFFLFQRMSVLIRVLPSDDPRLIHVLVKGAPEKIKELSDPDSIPSDFYEMLGQLTQRGYRVLGVGFRTLHMAWHKAEKLERYGPHPHCHSNTTLLYPLGKIQIILIINNY